jgi:DNA polymerase/3'-5' exonuclease PolX
MKTSIPLARAKVIATEIISVLSGACSRIAVAGSVRREKGMVGDIEIVCIPRFYTVQQQGLFGDAMPASSHSELDGLCSGLFANGKLQHRSNKDGRRAGWGRANKFGLYSPDDGSPPVPLDIFAVYPGEGEQWGVAMLIRTGPAEFNKTLVSRQNQGGVLPANWQIKVSDYTLRNAEDEILPTPKEADVFCALGIPYILPAQRTRQALLAAFAAEAA